MKYIYLVKRFRILILVLIEFIYLLTYFMINIVSAKIVICQVKPYKITIKKTDINLKINGRTFYG